VNLAIDPANGMGAGQKKSILLLAGV